VVAESCKFNVPYVVPAAVGAVCPRTERILVADNPRLKGSVELDPVVPVVM